MPIGMFLDGFQKPGERPRIPCFVWVDEESERSGDLAEGIDLLLVRFPVRAINPRNLLLLELFGDELVREQHHLFDHPVRIPDAKVGFASNDIDRFDAVRIKSHPGLWQLEIERTALHAHLSAHP